MSKFNRQVTVPVASPVRTETIPSGRTYEGGAGYARDAQSELFLLAVNHMGAKTFYEADTVRDARLEQLITEVAVADPAWAGAFIPWLRRVAGMRTASVIAGAESFRALHAAGTPGGRQVVNSALQRADEPGELLAYWMGRYGRKLPVGLNRGVSDAVGRLYNEFGFLRWDSREASLRFGDVIELVNPRYHLKEYGTWRDDLWRYAIEVRHGRGNAVPESLRKVRANVALRKAAEANPRALLDSAALWDACISWQDALSMAGSRVGKGALWSALIPNMGYMALVRNLRNFDKAGVSDEVAELVADRISDPGQVRKSLMFPFQFLSAYRAVPSLRWGHPLEKALTASLGNIPQLRGRTLILVDTSTSMQGKFQGLDGTLDRWDVAVLFGAAVAARADAADLVSFSGRDYTNEVPYARYRHFPLRAGESLLRTLDRWQHEGFFIGGGTDTALALAGAYSGHDRVIIVTDEQASRNGGEVSAAVPQSVPVYTWNIAGYSNGHAPSGFGTRHTFGGLTDHAFRLIPMLEAGRDARWGDLFAMAAPEAAAE
jgi:TROVE domain